MSKLTTLLTLFVGCTLIISGCAPTATKTTEATAVPATAVVAPVTEAASPVPQGGTLTFALSTEPDNLDPHVTPYAVSNEVLVNIFDSLVFETPDTHEILPWLATSWDISQDGLTWTFHLRDDVKFQDGTPFNAAAVKYNMDRIADPATKSGMAVTMLTPLYKGSEVVDDHTVKMTFSEPPAFLLSALATGFLGMVSPTAAEKWGLNEFGSHPVGSGPFIFVKWDRQDQIVLKKNPDYNWAPSQFKHQGPAYLDQVIFKIIPEDTVRVGTLQKGEVDAIEYTPPENYSTLSKDPNITVLKQVGAGMPESRLINVTKPPTDDLKVRQAIEYAIDRKSLVDNIQYGIPPLAYGPLSSRISCTSESLKNNYPYPYDPAKAKSLLDEAGWTDANGDGIREKGGVPLKILMITRQGLRSLMDEAMQAQLKAVGIDSEVRVVEAAAWLDIGSKGDANLIPLGWANAEPDVLRGAFGSENIGVGFNWSHFSNKEFDDLVKEAAITIDPNKRCELYGSAQQIVMDNAATVPIYEEDTTVSIRNNVEGILFDKSGYYRYLYDTVVK
jgi:peptide/nickel transport system substrate-binding protein